jgi:valyl-tRNA synthetase
MSKTKGNVIDPIEVTEKYGTDAVRFTLASMASPGTDIAFSESRTDGYRAFANKIWNAARFMFMNLDRVNNDRINNDRVNSDRVGGVNLTAGANEAQLSKLENRWIYSRFYRVAGEVNQSLADYRFDEAANTIYKFFWGEFCDWYLEIIKPSLMGMPEEARSALIFLGDVFEGSLRLLSPFMPFITEEVWHAMYDGKPPAKSIALARYPELDQRWLNDQAEEQMAVLQDLIEKVRNMRAEMKVEPKVKTPVKIHADDDVRKLITENRGMVERLASVDGIEFVDASLAQLAGARSTPEFEVALVYEQKVDVAAERERLNKELNKLENEMANANRQLGNEQFLAKAPAKVVEGIRRRQGELQALIEKVKTALAKLG